MKKYSWIETLSEFTIFILIWLWAACTQCRLNRIEKTMDECLRDVDQRLTSLEQDMAREDTLMVKVLQNTNEVMYGKIDPTFKSFAKLND